MHLNEFNQSPPAELENRLKHCVPIQSWGQAIIAARPFSSIQKVLDYATQLSQTWTWDEVQSALDMHPRIGEKRAKTELNPTEQAFSEREQAQLQSNKETQQALITANIAYEKKYGYIFLIKASGLNVNDILTALNYRLKNDPETEQRIVKQQLSEIAILRLTQELTA